MSILDDNNLYSGSGLSENAINHLRGTILPMRVIGIISLIFSGLYILQWFFQLSSIPAKYLANMIFPMLIGIGFVGLSIYMSWLILQTSAAYKRYADSRNEEDIAIAFRKQKIFWTIAAVVLAISIVLAVVLVFTLASSMRMYIK